MRTTIIHRSNHSHGHRIFNTLVLFIAVQLLLFSNNDVYAEDYYDDAAFTVCYLCLGDPTATISNPNGVVDLSPIGVPNQSLSCQVLFQAGLSGTEFLITECNAFKIDPDFQSICGCSNLGAPIPVPVPIPAPVPAPVPVPVPVVVPAPIPAPVPVPVPVVPTTSMPVSNIVPTVPVPIVPTVPVPVVPTTMVPLPASVRTPSNASQRVPSQPDAPVQTQSVTTRAQPVHRPRNNDNNTPRNRKPNNNNNTPRVMKPNHNKPNNNNNNHTPRVMKPHHNTPRVKTPVQRPRQKKNDGEQQQKRNNYDSTGKQQQQRDASPDTTESIQPLQAEEAVDKDNSIATTSDSGNTSAILNPGSELLIALDYSKLYTRQAAVLDGTKTSV